MILLILGLALWVAVHWLRRLTPSVREAMQARMCDGARGLIAAMVFLSVVWMVFGYRWADFIPVWQPPSFFGHINNLLMLVALYTYGASAAKGAKVWLGTKIRHPQLVGFSIWAFAHLLVNGDLAAMILFGTLLIWAQVSIVMINKAEGPWDVPERAPAKKEGTLIVITAVLYLVISAVHTWAGVSPFGGV
jgi:uncharacterized membrane protein